MNPAAELDQPHRRSIRLPSYDYGREGAYFVTISTKDHACLFGDVVDDDIRLNEYGRVAEQSWLRIPDHFPLATLDAVIVMPNHLHGIIVLAGANHHSPLLPLRPATPFRSPSNTIGSIVRSFKIGVTKWFRQNTNISDVWQRNYYEHVIWERDSLNRVRRYIETNPRFWALDRENPVGWPEDYPHTGVDMPFL